MSDLDGAFFFERAICLFAYHGALRCRLEVEISERKSKEDAWKNRLNGKGQSRRTTLDPGKSITVNGPQDLNIPEFNGLIEFA